MGQLDWIFDGAGRKRLLVGLEKEKQRMREIALVAPGPGQLSLIRVSALGSNSEWLQAGEALESGTLQRDGFCTCFPGLHCLTLNCCVSRKLMLSSGVCGCWPGSGSEIVRDEIESASTRTLCAQPHQEISRAPPYKVP